MERSAPTQRIRHFSARPAAGLSLVELLCVLAVVLVLLGSALPSLHQLRATLALRAAADLLETDLQYARSLAMAEGQPVRLAVQALADGGSCYLIHTGPAQSCQCGAGGVARCDSGSRPLRVVELDRATGLRLTPADRTLQFDSHKGTVTPTATLRLSDRDGRTIHQIVNIMGRVRSCSPTGLGGLRACS